MLEEKKVLKESLPNIILSLVIIDLLLLFKPSFWVGIGLVIVVLFFWSLFIAKGFSLKKFFFNSCLVILFGLAYKFSLARWGVVGVLLFLVGYVLYRIYRSKDLFMSGMRKIETRIFGKPLDKKEWEKKK